MHIKTAHIVILCLVIVGGVFFATQKLWLPLLASSALGDAEIYTETSNEKVDVVENPKEVETVPSPVTKKKDELDVRVSGKEVTLLGPSLVISKIEKCTISLGWFGPGGNGLSVDWGDGTTLAWSEGTEGARCADEQRTHTYTAPGTYTVHVRAWHPGPTDIPVTDWEDSVAITIL